MGFMSYKKRSKKEVEAILQAHKSGVSVTRICEKYSISETGFYRILMASRGLVIKSNNRSQSKIKKLESQVKERDKTILLLKAALKKS